MKNTETKRTEIPEVIMQAAKMHVKNRVEELTYFLAPLPSKRAQNLLQKIQNIAAAAEFAGSTYEEWEELDQMQKELVDYCSVEFYYDILSDCELTLEQQKLLINIAIVYHNAKSMVNRHSLIEINYPMCIYRNIVEWCNAAMKTVQIILSSMSIEMPDDEVCKVIDSKIWKMTGILIAYKELEQKS
ncbi:MAG: hypothetical protein IJO13_00425 [Lachnospiraceae bacterium]|nr:hypothetical protein [Lachnospiraceae bacterium]